MDAQSASIDTIPAARRQPFTATAAIELGTTLLAIAVIIASVFILSAKGAPERLTPTLLALLLVANLLPVVAVLMLAARRFARRRAAKMLAEGGGQLHTRLVGIFSLLASVPIVLTVIAASIMFQSGGQFWASDRASHAFDGSMQLARVAQDRIINRWVKESAQMALSVGDATKHYGQNSKLLHLFFSRDAYYRNFNQAALFSYSEDGGVVLQDYWQLPEDARPADQRPLAPPATMIKEIFSTRVTPKLLASVRQGGPIDANSGTTLWIVREVNGVKNTYLYVGSPVDGDFLNRQAVEGNALKAEYRGVRKNAGTLQLRFNIALFGVALLIMVVSAWVALVVADRLVRPLNLLLAAARRAAEGDLGVRVPEPKGRDEIATLGNAFNTMTERLQGQTNALVTANAQSESRRALIEAVMSGVSAGVISTDPTRVVRLINASARALLRRSEDDPVGRPLRYVAPELDELLDQGETEAVVQMSPGGEALTLAVKVTRDEDGLVLTFDDITQQLLDQRRAAWSDVARRIAHEIKNPLTPIQLAAERLQRRYGAKEDVTFAQLTETIVRQVGDLRRMVDEFSSFARMPKPVFRSESLLDIARQSLFLHEVAHPSVTFRLVHDDEIPPMVCDRRQMGQAFTNIVKNAIEAIEARGQDAKGAVTMTLAAAAPNIVTVEVADNGIGLPAARDRLVEPYVTTRARGTGLGLAIVKKIIEEHCGTIAFADREGGGTIVSMRFDTAALDALDAGAAAPENSADVDPRFPELVRNRT